MYRWIDCIFSLLLSIILTHFNKIKILEKQSSQPRIFFLEKNIVFFKADFKVVISTNVRKGKNIGNQNKIVFIVWISYYEFHRDNPPASDLKFEDFKFDFEIFTWRRFVMGKWTVVLSYRQIPILCNRFQCQPLLLALTPSCVKKF